MSWATGVMVYLVIWWTVLFAVLPLGVRRVENPGKGEERGAPERPELVAQGDHHLDRRRRALDRLLFPPPGRRFQLPQDGRMILIQFLKTSDLSDWTKRNGGLLARRPSTPETRRQAACAALLPKLGLRPRRRLFSAEAMRLAKTFSFDRQAFN